MSKSNEHIRITIETICRTVIRKRRGEINSDDEQSLVEQIVRSRKLLLDSEFSDIAPEKNSPEE